MTMDSNDKKSSPFRATRMWNQILCSFKEGMELKRKRYRLKSYDQCFTGAEALDWMHNYIQNNPTFRSQISREQIFLLLQKFVENGVFQNAVGKPVQKFQDTNTLYRFTEDVPFQHKDSNKDDKENLPSQSSLSNLLKNIRRNSKHLSSSDADQTPMGKSVKVGAPLLGPVNKQHCKITSVNGLTPLTLNLDNVSLKSSKVDAGYGDMSTIICDEDDNVFENSVSQQYFMRSNSLRLQKSEYSTKNLNFKAFSESQGEDDILFSKSIYKKPEIKQPVVKMLRKKVSLKTSKLSPPQKNNFRKRKSDEHVITSPVKKKKENSNKKNHLSSVLPRKAISILGENESFIKASDKMGSTDLSKLPGYVYGQKGLLKASNNNVNDKNTNSTNNSTKSPSTRKFHKTHSMRRRSFSQNSINLKQGKFFSTYDISKLSHMREPSVTENCNLNNSNLYKACSSWTINTIGLKEDKPATPQQSYELTATDLEDTWKSVTLLSLKKLLCTEEITTFLNTHEVNGQNIMKNVEWKINEIVKDAPEWLLSAMTCLSYWPLQERNLNDTLLEELPNYPGFERDVYKAIKEHYDSTLSQSLIPCHMYPLIEQFSQILYENTELSLKIMQHILLLLPCWSNRQLQLLVRFMRDISANEKLEISRDLLNKDLVVHTFFRHVIRRDKYSMTSLKREDGVSIKITMFLIDHYPTVFKPPSNIRFQVDHKLAVTLGAPSFSRMKTDRRTYGSQYSLRPSSADENRRCLRKQSSYCIQISKSEYEREAKEMSEMAVRDLLRMLKDDKTIHEKDRMKRLRQFQKAYPEVFNEEFPLDDISTCSNTSSSSTFKNAVKPSFLTEKIL